MKAHERIDWAAVRDRLERTGESLQRAIHPSSERLEQVFAERARRLASRRARTATPAGEPVLVVRAGKERYALPLTSVVRVMSPSACTPVPAGPRELIGVMSVGGEPRSVLDLGAMLGAPPSSDPGPGRVLLLRVGGREVALRVDDAEGIVRAPADRPAPDANAASPPVIGLTPDGVMRLDAGALLSHPALTRRGRAADDEAGPESCGGAQPT